jgi:NAD(P)-dependent dehydrogenase (short-subunit alcohol dehydrogenase family)
MSNVHELFNLKDHVAVVTGGAGYLGKYMALALAEAGANVVIADMALEKAQMVATEFSQKGLGAFALQFNADNENSICDMIGAVEQKYGRLDILVNAAFKFQENPIDTAKAADFEATLGVGITGYFVAAQKASEYMRQRRGGSIINIASMYGLVGSYPEVYKGLSACISPNYHAIKGAIVQLTRYMAVYWAQHNIRVNCVSPGPFPREDVRNSIPELIPRLEEKVPLGRIGKPDELKGAVLFLASQASSYVTGHNLVVDGGWTAW